MGPANLRHPGGFRLLLQQTSFPTDYGRKYLPGFYHPEAQTFPQFFRRKRKTEREEGYYKLIAGRLAQKGLISEIEADTIRPEIQVTGDALNSLAGKTPESSSPTAEEQ